MNKKGNILFFLREYKFSEQYFYNILSKISEDYDVIILHNSKLEKSSHVRGGFKNIDISYYSNSKLERLLNNFNPVKVFITNIRSLLDINFIISCNELGHELLYLEHGLTLNKIVKFKRANVFKTLKKYLIYGVNILRSKKFCSRFLKIYNPFINNKYEMLLINDFLLYSEYSLKILQKLFVVKESNIAYAGYPVVEGANELKKLINKEIKNQIVFIHQPLIIDNFIDMEIEEEISIFNNLYDIAKDYGLELVLKLHPRTNATEYIKHFQGKIIKKDISVEKVISESKIVIGFFSTALLTSLILNKQLLIFNSSKLKTNEIEVFMTEDNFFSNLLEFKNKLKLLQEGVLIKQIEVNKIAGSKNTHSDRYNQLIKLLNK